MALKKNKKKGKSSRKPSVSQTATLSKPFDDSAADTNEAMFGDWDPMLTNCQHYLKYHRGFDSCQFEGFSIDDDPADMFHKAHMKRFHTDNEHVGFCTAVDDGDEEPPLGDDEVLEFEHPLSMADGAVDMLYVSRTQKRHEVLADLLQFKDTPDLKELFVFIATITDPMTQPAETDTHVISLELLSQLIISLKLDVHSSIGEFNLALSLFKIVESTLKLLNCEDQVKLRGLNNSDLKIDWRNKLKEWTPNGLNQQDLLLIYMIDCVCLYTIYKIYEFNDPDLCMNPFLDFFINLWKIFTNVVLLGLEVDRREEVDGEETPDIIKYVIRGSSAVRYVLASILNDEVKDRLHDFQHLNIRDFMSPYGRRCGTAALCADVRWYVGAMLALGSDLKEVVEILVDLEPNDRYDEDVKYMFTYEYEDFHHEEMFPEDYEAGEIPDDDIIMYFDEDGHFHRVVRPRCTCQFFDNDMESETQENEEFDSIPHAVRSDQNIKFDELGRDWRDIARGGNIFFNPEFQLDASGCYSWPELCQIFDEMVEHQVTDEISTKVIKTIARSVKLELEKEITDTISDNTDVIPEDAVTTDKIYDKWSSDWPFDAMLSLNPQSSYAMLDEMFMANGYRRVLIWFLTHIPLSFSLINYIFELLEGLRGEGRISKKFKFSRQGPLELSEIEKSMLLHELLGNCTIYISKVTNDGKPSSSQNYTDVERCVKIIKLLCLMIQKLIDTDDIDIEEYKVGITSLLINWIGIIPEAKDLFFRINNTIGKDKLSEPIKTHEAQLGTEPKHASIPNQRQPSMKHRKFSPELKESLSNVIKKLDNGSFLFRPFFELIEGGNSSDAPEAEVGAPPQFKLNPENSIAETQTPKYIPGGLRPLIRDENADHLIAEQALMEPYDV